MLHSTCVGCLSALEEEEEVGGHQILVKPFGDEYCPILLLSSSFQSPFHLDG